MVKRQNGTAQDKPFQSVKDAARSTGLSEHYLRTEIKKGTIAIIMSGNKAYINMSKLMDRLNA